MIEPPRSRRRHNGPHFGMKQLLAFVAIIALLFSVGPWVWNDLPEANTAANQIEIGMTRQEVLEILGPPHSAKSEPVWYYKVAGRLDSLEVDFDSDEVVWVSF